MTKEKSCISEKEIIKVNSYRLEFLCNNKIHSLIRRKCVNTYSSHFCNKCSSRIDYVPDTIIIFGNTTVEKMVLVTTLRFTMCVCVGDKLFGHTNRQSVW